MWLKILLEIARFRCETRNPLFVLTRSSTGVDSFSGTFLTGRFMVVMHIAEVGTKKYGSSTAIIALNGQSFALDESINIIQM